MNEPWAMGGCARSVATRVVDDGHRLILPWPSCWKGPEWGPAREITDSALNQSAQGENRAEQALDAERSRAEQAEITDVTSAHPQPPAILPYFIVAIGASAGGLHAFAEFLGSLPPDTGMAFVLIQHLDPVHKSLLVSLLAPHTAMKVVEAADGMPVMPNMVFVIPPYATMTIGHGRLAVASPAPARENR